MKKQEVKDLLSKGAVTISFQKADGTPRLMHCTLNENMFRYDYKENGGERKSKDDVLSVWDIDSNGWRSFRWDRVREVNDTKTPNGIRE